jgi:hypothetical protein
MPTIYVDRFIGVCPVSLIAQADAFWATLDPDTGGGSTFANGIPLSSDGNEPITHRYIDSVFTAEMRSGAQTVIRPGGPLKDAAAYFTNEDRELQSQFNGSLTIGQTVDITAALSDQGLQVVNIDD